MTSISDTAFAAKATANIWDKRLGHPNEQVVKRVKNITESGIDFVDTLSGCETCKINKKHSTKPPKNYRQEQNH